MIGSLRDRAWAAGANQELRGCFSGRAGGGKTDALHRAFSQGGNALQAQGQIGAPFVGGQGMNFVHDNPAQGREKVPSAWIGQKDGEAFRRR